MSALADSLLSFAKQHMRVDFADDDIVIGRYLNWAIAYVENESGWQLVSSDIAWSPVMTTTPCRAYQFPAQPVASFTVMSGGLDVTVDYRKQSAGRVSPVWLIRNDGDVFPADIAVSFKAGYSDAAALPPDIEAAILRIAATLYENRETVSSDSLDPVPYWLRDLIGNIWIPRA